ncbi:MAG TPA: LysM peptidoglycan-binding domain-containing protein, partial [Oligoflexia bacterium]|nr:LysM peptidoglycan-binding domain-containing protein [Oligoflexia bacterium]
MNEQSGQTMKNEITVNNPRHFLFSYISIGHLVCTLFCSLLLMLTACAPGTSQPEAPPAEPPRAPDNLVHVIQYPGETLGIIAKWYTGKTENWNLIVQANPGIKPNRLRLGQHVIIPAELLIKREVLPRTAVKISVPKTEPLGVEPPAADPFGM